MEKFDCIFKLSLRTGSGRERKKIGGRSSLRVVIQNWATSEASRRGRNRRIRKVNKEVVSMPIVKQNRLAWDIAHSFFSL